MNLTTHQSKMIKLHFVDENHTRITCRDCIDYQLRQCDGKGYTGDECIKCIQAHADLMHKSN